MSNIDYTIDITKPKCTGDIEYGAMTFLRNSNPNGISPELLSDKDGSYLRLAVARDAYTKATDGEPDTRDRCELRDSKLQLGTPVWYSFVPFSLGRRLPAALTGFSSENAIETAAFSALRLRTW